MDVQPLLDSAFAVIVFACIAIGLAACGDPDLPRERQIRGGGVERMYAPSVSQECREARE